MKTTINKYLCRTCANRSVARNNQPACALHQKLIDPDTDFCSQHIDAQNIITCDLCGKTFSTKDIIGHIDENDNLHYLCASCHSLLYTCPTCSYSNVCGFATDHSAPQIVNQTVQKGFMTMQTQVKNPQLVEKHCISCRCSCDDKGTCLKESPTICANWASKL